MKGLAITVLFFILNIKNIKAVTTKYMFICQEMK